MYWELSGSFRNIPSPPYGFGVILLSRYRIHLMELSPPAFRSLIVGLTYQLGNLASSASSTIEATIGERFPLPRRPGEAVTYNYGRVMCIFMGAVSTLFTLSCVNHL